MRHALFATLLLFTLPTLAAPTVARACGGFFCNSATLEAVDQTKERILFDIGDGTITTVVEIGFSGESDSFSWVVPVPVTPALDVVPPSSLRILDAATSPRLLPPAIDWGEPDDQWSDDDDAASDDDDSGDDDDDDDDTVVVEDLPVVGPFDPEVVSSEDPGALIDWLNDNGYLITEAMEPFVAEYVAAGMKFLCMKLAPEAGISDIAPIAMTWEGSVPMIPLRLTAVAAQPEMQVQVFVAGASRYEPINVPLIPILDDELRADPRNGDNNYHSLLAWKIDQAGGEGFAIEQAESASNVAAQAQYVNMATADAPEARAWLLGVLSGHAMVTRMLTRASGSEMTVDPTFGPTGSNVTVSSLHDLRDQDPVFWDLEVNPPKPCNDLYCGTGGLCALDANGREGCACADGWLARSVERPSVSAMNQGTGVACVSAGFDLMADLPGIAGADPCDGVSCGNGGSCVPLGGSPTCDCAEGGMAAMQGGQLTCLELVAAYPPEALLWGDVNPVGEEDLLGAGCSGDEGGCVGSLGGGEGTLLALLVVGARRRRQRAGIE